MIALALAAFVSTFVADFAWARYMTGVAEKRPHNAAAWSAVIVLLGGVTVLAYTTNKWMVIPAALGAYGGTLGALRKTEP